MDVIIKNGSIVTAIEEYSADIGIKDGKIASIGRIEGTDGARVIDAAGKFILPGVIDMHTHIDHWGGSAKTGDDFFTGTRAAAFGGVTTIIDFAIQQQGETVEEAVNRRRREADGMVCIDYGLHGHVTNADAQTLTTVKGLISEGYPSIKMFTTYKKAGFKIEDFDCLTLMGHIHEQGGLVMIHAENDSMCESLTEELLKTGRATPENYPDSRPNISEAECIARMILFSEQTNASIYIVHVSTKEGLELIRDAKRRGVKVTAETCPHYLLLSRDRYQHEGGHKYIMAPPLRSEPDLESLWQGIQEEVISVVSSDHCAFSEERKLSGKQDFTSVSPGIHGTEWLLPLMYHFGVNQGKISKQQLVKVLSYQPAQIFGLAGQKGHISIGYDADIVIYDPDTPYIINDHNHHMASDFSPYKGFELVGRPETVLSKGKVIVDQGQFYGQKGHGRFVKRTTAKSNGAAVDTKSDSNAPSFPISKK